MTSPYLVIDFDSTFVTLESLDELAGIALAGHAQRAEILKRLNEVTDLGMEGKIGFAESLELRMSMFEVNNRHIEQLVELLRKSITPSVLNNLDFFRSQADRIYIMSGGFRDYILPVVEAYGLLPSHVLANEFYIDTKGNVTGYDKTCPLAHDGGKAEQVALLDLDGPVYAIGDGYTDYQLKALGQAQKFLAFTENVRRETVVSQADIVLTSFDQLVALES